MGIGIINNYGVRKWVTSKHGRIPKEKNNKIIYWTKNELII
jgi:hypothetical protein